MHCGPVNGSSQTPPELSTTVSESEEYLSDSILLDSKTCWDSDPRGNEIIKGEHMISPIHLEDGPPWREDDDLQSPVVVSSRHRRHKSSGSTFGARGRSGREAGEKLTSILGQPNHEHDRRLFPSRSIDGYKEFFGKGDAGDVGSEISKYSADDGRHFDVYNVSGQRDSHFAGTLPSRSYADDAGHEFSESENSSNSSPGLTRREESRYSRDYQFTITSSDEEMHGKAVALFDFMRENENELPLIEGQVIWVSYRHGQGWLVAEDPKTRESGLVPESYVRLLRDIHGELSSNAGQVGDTPNSLAQDSGMLDSDDYGHVSGNFPNRIDYQLPVVSTFSTSSMDLHPYPHHLLGTQSGQVPPQVTHYHGQCGGSHANTPTTAGLSVSGSDARIGRNEVHSDQSLCLTTAIDLLPMTKLESSISVQSPRCSSSSLSEPQSDDEITTNT